MNETMQNLLQVWAELEDVNCTQWLRASELDSVQLLHIQAAVQQAIVARGWGFTVYTVLIDKIPPYRAGVEDVWEVGDSAAEALLRAYLAALKKEKSDE